MEKKKYDSTVSTSRQESMMKAVDLLLEELSLKQEARVFRPDIRIGQMCRSAILWLLPVLAVFFLAYLFPATQKYNIWITVFAAACVFFLNLKKIVVSAILIYQRYAPESIRLACVYQPTCSNYMLLAIEKYGVIRGVIKGIKRLARCHYPNSGIDYP